MLTSDDTFMMSSTLSLDDVILRVLDHDFSLSVGEANDEEGESSSFLGDCIIDLNTILSMS